MNLYNYEIGSFQKLKPNGKATESGRFWVCAPLSISEGDQITFGPARLGAPVLGFFYDEQGNPLALIDYKNIEIAHTFKEGMVMAKATAPQGAKAIRLQMPLQDRQAFHIYINEECPAIEEPKNPFFGRNFLTVGDSLCDANNDNEIDGLRGWARRIYQRFGANVVKNAKAGAALSNSRENPRRPRKFIMNQLIEEVGVREHDYILMEGGANDVSDKVAIGEISASFDPATFDISTYAGALEKMIYLAVKHYGDTAAMGYMSIYKTPDEPKFKEIESYFAVGEKICEKWGIAYLDMFHTLTVDTKKYTVDNVHANAEGYDLMQPTIDAFLPKLRAVPAEIYSKVCE